MRPRNEPSRHQLVATLRRQAGLSAPALAERAGVSVPTLHRLLQEQREAIVSRGRARRTRYALRRALRGEVGALPLYAVDREGRAEPVAQLDLIQPQGACMDIAEAGWPVPEASRDGWWDGLPYPLVDMRPQGYLGRQLARAEHQALGVSSNPDEWSDDDVVHVLSRLGSDVSGDLILGVPAFERWQQRKLAPPDPVKPRSVGRAYAGLAEQAIAAGVAGSSAAGEFPKFPALREQTGSDTPHVLVKFSGADGSPAVRRWAELLVCEHLALVSAEVLPGVHSAKTRIVEQDGRSFLEAERFDRHGAFGRSPLVSLGTLDAALLGAGSSDWTRLAARLHAGGWIDAASVACIEHLWWFGRLIANTDMHTGNLSFEPQGGRLRLAPTYDMLPMLYAPLPGGEVPARSFEPGLPLPPQRPAWMAACGAAISFWQAAASDARIGEDFRSMCARNVQQLQRARDSL